MVDLGTARAGGGVRKGLLSLSSGIAAVVEGNMEGSVPRPLSLVSEREEPSRPHFSWDRMVKTTFT